MEQLDNGGEYREVSCSGQCADVQHRSMGLLAMAYVQLLNINARQEPLKHVMIDIF